MTAAIGGMTIAITGTPTGHTAIVPLLGFDGQVPKPSAIRDRAERARALVLIGLVTLTIAGAITAAALRSEWGTVAALGACLVIELGLGRVSPFAVTMTRQANAGPPVRTALRMLAVVLLAGRCLSGSLLVAAAVTAAAVTALVIAIEAARLAIARVRRLPLVTRNIDLGDLTLPRPLPRLVMDPVGLDAAAPLLAAVGLALAIHHSGSAPVAGVGLGGATAVVLAPVVVLAASLLTLVRAKLRTRLTEAAVAAIEQLRPEVLLYFAATPEELYQLRMWLRPLAELDHPVAVVVRSYEVFDALADVTVPVICTPYNGTIAALPLPSRVAGLFVTHSGNNLSLIRRPEVRSVFIGHGDSDKPDSVNPFARVYDEVWVAGPLGRRRYEQAAIGVRDAALVEIGRPPITVVERPPTVPPTVVYAPTWEGWGDDPHHSSLAHVGVDVVERLSARPDIRVRYRAHPLAGRRDRDVRAAHERILQLVEAVPPEETLSETFASSAGLVGDVSSVINEYLPYDRPYAVVDTRGIGPDMFGARFPSTRGGFVLSLDLGGLDEFVAAVLGGADATRTIRRELVADALGDPATSQRRFANAVSRLLSG
jgi:hypothetical protein